MTRAAIVYVSVHHGNTQQVAAAIGDVLQADLFEPEQVTPDDLARYDLVGFGSGIYYGMAHRRLKRFLDRLPPSSGRAFLFTTSGLPWLSRLYHRPLRSRVRRAGWTVAGEFACRGWDTWGPLWFLGGLNRRHPNAKDKERAAEFGRTLLSDSST